MVNEQGIDGMVTNLYHGITGVKPQGVLQERLAALERGYQALMERDRDLAYGLMAISLGYLADQTPAGSAREGLYNLAAGVAGQSRYLNRDLSESPFLEAIGYKKGENDGGQ